MAKTTLRTAAPDALSDADRDRLRAWCTTRFPAQLRRLGELEEACLEYHGARGNLMASWLKAVQSWVRLEVSGKYSRSVGTAWRETANMAEFGKQLASRMLHTPPCTAAEMAELERRRRREQRRVH